MLETTLLEWAMNLVIAGDDGRVWWTLRGSFSALAPSPRSAVQKRVLFVSILGNLAVLGFFKYVNFAADSLYGILGAAGLARGQWDTFYRGSCRSASASTPWTSTGAKALRNFIDFACFVSIFSHLVARLGLLG